jgi:hypothetical protein
MDIAKVVEIVASSDKSFEDAARQGVARAAKTLHGISGIKIKDWTARVESDQITQFKVTMDVAFRLDG